MFSAAQESARDERRIPFDSTKTGAQKFFWITSLNRAVDHPFAIGIARIARLAIRMHVASRDREDRLRAPSRGADERAQRRFDG
jgi:hypothetical protein